MKYQATELHQMIPVSYSVRCVLMALSYWVTAAQLD